MDVDVDLIGWVGVGLGGNYGWYLICSYVGGSILCGVG